MPVAPYDTEKYRTWNRDRMRQHRREGVVWDRHYEGSDLGMFMRSTYEGSTRRMVLRRNCDRSGIAARLGVTIERLEPKQTMTRLNRYRDQLRMFKRCGGFEMYKVRLNSGL